MSKGRLTFLLNSYSADTSIVYPVIFSDFKNITASDEPTMSIHSMGESSFTLSDGLIIHTPMIVLNKQVLLWDAPDLTPTSEKPIMPNGIGWEAWTDEAWRIFEMVSPRPGES